MRFFMHFSWRINSMTDTTYVLRSMLLPGVFLVPSWLRQLDMLFFRVFMGVIRAMSGFRDRETLHCALRWGSADAEVLASSRSLPSVMVGSNACCV